jgi:hypothetical protein
MPSTCWRQQPQQQEEDERLQIRYWQQQHRSCRMGASTACSTHHLCLLLSQGVEATRPARIVKQLHGVTSDT